MGSKRVCATLDDQNECGKEPGKKEQQASSEAYAPEPFHQSPELAEVMQRWTRVHRKPEQVQALQREAQVLDRMLPRTAAGVAAAPRPRPAFLDLGPSTEAASGTRGGGGGDAAPAAGKSAAYPSADAAVDALDASTSKLEALLAKNQDVKAASAAGIGGPLPPCKAYQIPSLGPRPFPAVVLLLWAALQRCLASTANFTLSPDYGQLQGERQRFRVTGASRTYVSSHSWLEIDYAGLAHNAQTVLEHVGEDVIPLAVVKGNGYGHGLTVAAQVFLDSGFRELGVADLNEAITLRQEGVTVPIHIMFQPDHLSAREMALDDVDVYVEEPSFLHALCQETRAVPRSVPMNVHVAVATRKMPQGVRTFPEVLELAQAVEACPSLHLRGVMTHGGDYERFNSVLRRMRGAGVRWEVAHMASSWHLMKGRELHMGAVRLGAALYGQQRIVPGTRPAARWLTRIVRIKKVDEGEPAHGVSHSERSNMTVAIFYNGYTDGFQVEEVVIRGQRCKRVDMGHSMRLAAVDVSAVPAAQVDDLVLLHGVDEESGVYLEAPWNLARVSSVVPRVPKWS
ncbi:hypothetical protein WJX81_000018 [Elliptochloris bilobata]|uniref:Alanine racemase C-terminal domain-containing protein n=1 Tax=Elliptochloris bilobata TaxID=381761 RepID=A0AAW1SFV9_9CHLO